MEPLYFLVALLFFFVVPGHAIVLVLGVDCKGLTNLNVSVALGLISSSIIYRCFAYFGFFEANILFGAVCLLGVGFFYFKSFKKTRVSGSLSSDYPVHILFFLLVAFTAFQYSQIPYYAVNLLAGPEGISVTKTKDVLLHVSLASELARNIPPSIPFISGLALKYHHGMDLIAAIFVKYAGFSAADIVLRYLPYLSMSFAMLSVYTFTKALTGHYKVALILVFLVIWADDFSQLFYQLSEIDGLFGGLEKRIFYSPPSFFSLFYINPMIYGLAFLFTGLTLLRAYFNHKTWPYMVICALVFAYAGNFKIFIPLQIIGTFSIAVIVLGIKSSRELQKLLAVTTIFFVMFFYQSVLDGIFGNGLVEIKPVFFSGYIPDLISKMGIPGIYPFSLLFSIYETRTIDPGGFVMFFAANILYVIVVLGARSFALPVIVSEIAKRTNPVMVISAVFVLIGPFLTLFSTVLPVQQSEGYNNSVWFLVQSKYLAWIFFAPFLLHLTTIQEKSLSDWVRKLTLLTFSLIIAYYSTAANFRMLDFFKHTRVFMLDKAYSHLEQDMREKCRDGETILAEDYWVNYLLVGLGCKTVLFPTWPATLAARDELALRTRELNAFWSNFEKGNPQSSVLRKYGVSYLIHGETHEVKYVGGDNILHVD